MCIVQFIIFLSKCEISYQLYLNIRFRCANYGTARPINFADSEANDLSEESQLVTNTWSDGQGKLSGNIKWNLIPGTVSLPYTDAPLFAYL